MSFITNAVGSLIGSLTGSNQQAQAAQTAAQTQANAANYAANLQNAQFQQTQANLSPYMSIGTAVLPQLLSSLGYQGQFGSNGQLTGVSGQGFQFNPANLAQTPGYQFTLQQGLNAVNNAASATGQNASGAQAKGLANYATGLAQNTYNQQYQNALQTYQQNASTLGSLLSTGQNAAAGLGSMGMQNAANVGNTLQGGANATAAGQIAAGNTQSNALTGAMQLGLGGAGIYSLLGKSGLFGSAAGGAGAATGISGLTGATSMAPVDYSLLTAPAAASGASGGLGLALM